MEPTERPAPLVSRAIHALRSRGPRYAQHKVLRRLLGRWPGMKRKLVYADPKEYWTLRGGHDYFREQEGQPERSARAEWIAEKIAKLKPRSILEVGCGYGKQVRAIRARLGVPITGLDFSRSQLDWARGYLDGLGGISLVLGSGDRLPFEDDAFDLVLTSAVILHNPPPIAETIRNEVVRVARRWAAHNEDTDVSYNRFGYDTAAWYADRGIPVIESVAIPDGDSAGRSQFCVARP